MIRPHALLFVTACVVWAPAASDAQVPGEPPAPQVLTLDEAIHYAADHYPAIKAALQLVDASAAGVDVARAAYLPHLDALWQSNRGTVNNIFGPLLPQSVLPALTGPVLPSPSGQSVWSSATGATFSWEPFDFGLRHATVAGAQAGLTEARAADTLTRLEVQSAVAQAFLNVLAAERAVAAAQANVDRRNVLFRSVQALVVNELRPGADASRAEAERAAALTRLIQSQQVLAVARAALRRALGITTGEVAISGDRLLKPAPAADMPPAAATAHPLALARNAAVGRARAVEDELARTNLPRVFLQASAFARGSGANANGTLDSGAGGLGLDRGNWVAGVQIVLPNVFDFATVHARKAAAAASERATEALYDEALLAISNERQAAAALVQSSRAVAANTPVQLAAAQLSEQQARARYDAGLATIVEVADAQDLLAEAEVQEQLARVDVWRALLAAAVAEGDLAPFVNSLRQP